MPITQVITPKNFTMTSLYYILVNGGGREAHAIHVSNFYHKPKQVALNSVVLPECMSLTITNLR